MAFTAFTAFMAFYWPSQLTASRKLTHTHVQLITPYSNFDMKKKDILPDLLPVFMRKKTEIDSDLLPVFTQKQDQMTSGK